MSTPVPRSKKTIFSLWLIVIAIWVAGFLDLVRGGTTISAILLAIVYCVGVPLVIWFGGRWAVDAKATRDVRTGDEDVEHPSYRVAGVVGLGVLSLYLVTMAPSTAMWDTSEYIAAAYTFGLPHPPGNPFFVILGHVFSLLPVASNVAARVNVLAAICSAVAAAMWFLVAEHVALRWTESTRTALVGGVIAAVIGATAFTVWNQSVVNEKVYTVSLAGIAIISWLAIRWSSRPEAEPADRLLVMIAYLCGLGYANHMAGMLPAPAIATMVLIRRPATVLRGRLLVGCAIALIAGLTPFATQPIRAAYFPALDEGAPTACRTKLELSCTFSKGTLDAFEYNFNRGQYGKPDLSDRQATFDQQIGMWWLYFKWQWLRDPNDQHAFPQALLAATFLVLGLVGAWIHFEADRKSFWYFGALMFTTTLLLIYYLNFKLGASQDPAAQAAHEVRDRDYFFLWSYSAWGVWAALGLMYVWQSIAALVPAGRRARLAASPVLALALAPLACNWTSASRAHHYATRDVAADMLNSVEPYGVLVTVGDNDTFPLWYAQEVEGIRRDVVVANTSLLNTDWYVRQIIRRPIYTYDAAKGPQIYRDKQWPKPTTPPLHMTMADADAVPAYYQLPQPMVFNSGPIHAKIDPRQLQDGVLYRADLFVLRMIQDAWPQRPIYFARSSGSYPRSLGLGDDMLTQGLASKLFVPPTTATRDTVPVAEDGWLDVARTRQLWTQVFKGQQSIIREGQWIDRPSAGMPALYLFAGAELSEALRAVGQPTEANAVLATTRGIAHATNFDDFMRAFDQRPQTPAPGDSGSVTIGLDASRQPKVQSTESRRVKP